ERGERSSPGASDGFRDLLEALELGAMQQLADIEQNDQPAFQLADSRDVARLAFGKDRARRFDFRRRNLQHFRGSVDDQADELVFQFDDQDSILFFVMDVGLTEALAEIHHGNNFPAQIDHALDHVGRAWNGGNVRHADNFPHRTNADAIRFIPDAKPDDLQVLFHQRVSAALGTNEFGVLFFMRTA